MLKKNILDDIIGIVLILKAQTKDRDNPKATYLGIKTNTWMDEQI